MITIYAIVTESNYASIAGEIPVVTAQLSLEFIRDTQNENIVMGFNTWQLFGEVPIPNRTTYVLTRNPNKVKRRGVKVITTAQQAPKNSYIVGGVSTFNSFLYMADEIVIKRIHTKETGRDILYFPDLKDWKLKDVDNVEDTECIRHTEIWVKGES